MVVWHLELNEDERDYDRTIGLVIIAANEGQARRMAAYRVVAIVGRSWALQGEWLDPGRTTCEPIGLASLNDKPRIVLVDVQSG